MQQKPQWMSPPLLLPLPLVRRLVAFPIPSLVPPAIFHRPPLIDIDCSDRWDHNHRLLPLPQPRPIVDVTVNTRKQKHSQLRETHSSNELHVA
jgi:hypothetical protein